MAVNIACRPRLFDLLTSVTMTGSNSPSVERRKLQLDKDFNFDASIVDCTIRAGLRTLRVTFPAFRTDGGATHGVR
jgi:hypothetical protein